MSKYSGTDLIGDRRTMPKAAKITIGIVVGVAVVFCVGSFVLDRHLLGQTYARYTPEGPSFMLTDADIAVDYPYEDVEFQLDSKTLRGHVYGADNARGLVIARHGIFSQHQDYLALITALVDKGWKVFAYDAIGCGESDGDSVIGFAQSPIDVRAAVQFARESGMADGLPIVLFGHSWGGYGVAGALDFDDVRDNVAACVTMSGFDTPMGIIMESAENSMGPIASLQGPFIDLIGRLEFRDDANRSASRAISGSGVPTLVIHGTEDEVVSYGGTSIIAQRDSITNQQVEYITESEPGRNGHNTYFYSPESQAYLAECADKLAALQSEYGENVPEDVLSDFMAGVDKRRANTADPVLIDEIDAFLSDAIGR